MDWLTLEHHTLYTGQLGRIEDDRSQLSPQNYAPPSTCLNKTSCRAQARPAEPSSAVADVACRSRTSRRGNVSPPSISTATAVRLDGLSSEGLFNGSLRFSLSGPQTGIRFDIIDADGDSAGTRSTAGGGDRSGRKGSICAKVATTPSATCSARFGNAVNFRGEPFLPGNDLLARYGPAMDPAEPRRSCARSQLPCRSSSGFSGNTVPASWPPARDGARLRGSRECESQRCRLPSYHTERLQSAQPFRSTNGCQRRGFQASFAHQEQFVPVTCF